MQICAQDVHEVAGTVSRRLFDQEIQIPGFVHPVAQILRQVGTPKARVSRTATDSGASSTAHAGSHRLRLIQLMRLASAPPAALAWNMALAWQVWRRAARLAAFSAKLKTEHGLLPPV